MIEPPWTPEEVAALNRFQHTQWVHPFTCPGRADHPLEEGERGRLVATGTGWVCLHCSYTQNWAHRHMLSVPPNPFPMHGGET